MSQEPWGLDWTTQRSRQGSLSQKQSGERPWLSRNSVVLWVLSQAGGQLPAFPPRRERLLCMAFLADLLGSVWKLQWVKQMQEINQSWFGPDLPFSSLFPCTLHVSAKWVSVWVPWWPRFAWLSPPPGGFTPSLLMLESSLLLTRQLQSHLLQEAFPSAGSSSLTLEHQWHHISPLLITGIFFTL